MNRRKAAVYARRNGISKQRTPFVAVWARKLTTKERATLKENPHAMFMKRTCPLVYAWVPDDYGNTPNAEITGCTLAPKRSRGRLGRSG